MSREYPDRPIVAVGAAVCRGDRVLVVQRAREPSRGAWTVPGGVVDLGEEMAQAAKAPLLGQLPIDPELARLCDEGTIERYNSDAFMNLSQAFAQILPKVG